MQRTDNERALMLEAGYVYRYAKRYKEARQVFQATLALLPQSEVSDLALAGVFFDEGKYDDATAHCKRALVLNPSNAVAYNQLAEIQVQQRDYVRAKQNLQRAMELVSKGPIAEWTTILMKVVSIALSTTQSESAISI